MRLVVILTLLPVAACTTIDPRVSIVLPDPDNAWYDAGQAELSRSLARRNRPDRARNVILFIGDGLGISTITAARILEGQQLGGSGEEHALSFEKFPYVALAKTYNTNAQVPDSAGTSTAMLTGVKTKMGVLGVDDGTVRGDCSSLPSSTVPTLLEYSELAGLATGIVTTTRITHATPAAAYAHIPERNWEAISSQGCPDIAQQLVGFAHGDGPEVLLGGGRAALRPNTAADPEYAVQTGWRTDGRDLIAEWILSNDPSARYVWNKAQFDAVDTRQTSKLLGLFEPSHMQFEADRDDSPDGEPSLSAMVEKAIRMLRRSNKGYFMLVEGGRIDHAHHGSNAYRALHDTIALSDAVSMARSLTDPDDTLIIVTADHGHVMEIAGYPKRGNPILGKITGLNSDGSPAGGFALDALGKPYTTLVYGNGPGHVARSDRQSAGVKNQANSPKRFLDTPYSRPDLTDVDTEDLNYLQESAVPLGSETHSGTDVAIYADGPGARLFHGVHEQNYIFHVMAYALFGN